METIEKFLNSLPKDHGIMISDDGNRYWLDIDRINEMRKELSTSKNLREKLKQTETKLENAERLNSGYDWDNPRRGKFE